MKRLSLVLSLAAVLALGVATPAFAAGVDPACVKMCAKSCGFSGTMNPSTCAKGGATTCAH